MINILLITTDQRALVMVEQLQSQPQIRVAVVPDFDQGLKDVFDKRPQLVFIQGEIDGVSGETVARHIKGLLREQSPRLILLRETLQVRVGAKSCYDGSIDLFLDEDDLLNAFREQMESIAGFVWQKIVPDGESAIPVMSTVDQYAEALAAATAEPAGPLTYAPPFAPPSPPGNLASQPSASPESSASRPAEPLPDNEQSLSPLKPLAEPAYSVEMPSPEPISAVGGAREFHGTLPPFESRFYGRKSQRRPWLYVITFLAILALCAVVYLYLLSRPQVVPAGKSSKPAAGPPSSGQPAVSSVTTAKVLDFITKNRPDTGYTATHPGWERYTSEAMEFLVFRENGAVKAIQIVALGQRGLSAPFIAERLQDVSGSSAYQVGSRTEKDNFLVEKGTAQGGIELVIYRKRLSGDIRALVIAFP